MCCLTYNRRHPVILPDESSLATLWIAKAHRCCLHGSVQLTLSTLRQHCWILRGRHLVKAIGAPLVCDGEAIPRTS